MQNYWAGQNFPLFPSSIDDLYKMRGFIGEIFRHMGAGRYIFFIMAAALFVISFVRKNVILVGCYFGILLACFASYINMFPIEDRLWCFFYSMICMFGFIGINELLGKNSKLGIFILFLIIAAYAFLNAAPAFFDYILIAAVFCLISENKDERLRSVLVGLLCFELVFSNNGIRDCLKRENIYRPGEELNDEIEYLEKNIRQDEKVYVYFHSVEGFEYKNGIGKKTIGAVCGNNVILGTTLFTDADDCEEEIAEIISCDKLYIASSHINTERLSRLLEAVYKEGYLQLALFNHNTPLWFYCRDVSDSKVHVSYSLIDKFEDKNTESIKLEIKNDGEAYLNHMYETVSLVNCETGDRFELQKNMAPGSSMELIVLYEKGSEPDFQLENEYGLVCEDSRFNVKKYGCFVNDP